MQPSGFIFVYQQIHCGLRSPLTRAAGRRVSQLEHFPKECDVVLVHWAHLLVCPPCVCVMRPQRSQCYARCMQYTFTLQATGAGLRVALRSPAAQVSLVSLAPQEVKNCAAGLLSATFDSCAVCPRCDRAGATCQHAGGAVHSLHAARGRLSRSQRGARRPISPVPLRPDPSWPTSGWRPTAPRRRPSLACAGAHAALSPTELLRMACA
jgi:hypothetical protein